LLKPSFGILARNWWPVAAWLGVIRLESTDLGSSAHTSSLLYQVLSFFVPRISPFVVWELDALLRKTGHFVGYAILSALVFLAMRNTYRDRLEPALRRTWGTRLSDLWRWEWVLLGMMAAALVASLDELHQSYIPSRTGRWQDVLIDSSGAALVQVGLYIYSAWRASQARERTTEPELAPTR
jgi:VanZ family protein